MQNRQVKDDDDLDILNDSHVRLQAQFTDEEVDTFRSQVEKEESKEATMIGSLDRLVSPTSSQSNTMLSAGAAKLNQ
jgi:acylphosphatase